MYIIVCLNFNLDPILTFHKYYLQKFRFLFLLFYVKPEKNIKIYIVAIKIKYTKLMIIAVSGKAQLESIFVCILKHHNSIMKYHYYSLSGD